VRGYECVLDLFIFCFGWVCRGAAIASIGARFSMVRCIFIMGVVHIINVAVWNFELMDFFKDV